MVDNYGYTALLLACSSGHHECAQALINAGAAVDKEVKDGATALMWACDKGHHECAQALIDARADLELTKPWRRECADDRLQGAELVVFVCRNGRVRASAASFHGADPRG